MRLLPENPPQITDRAVRRAWSAVVLVAMLVAVGSMGGVLWLSSENEDLSGKVTRSDTERAKLSKRLDREEADSAKLKEGSVALAEQVERLGGKPVVDPADPTAPPRALGPTAAQVQDAIKVVCAGEQSLCSPTQAQVRAALAAICGDCRGKDAAAPRDGRNGSDATAAQIDAALARHCVENDCRGPGPTDQQVDERIAARCANDACKGDDGDKGEPGTVTPGDYTCPDGEWITAIHVAEGGAMTVDCSPLLRQD